MSSNTDTWKITPLGKYGEIISGGTPDRNNKAYWDGDIPWVTPSEITSNKGKYLQNTREKITKEGLNASSANLLPKNSLLITSRATLGEVAIAAISVSTNQGFKSIIPNCDTDPVFAYYLTKTLKSEMVRLASGTTFLEISKGDFARIVTHRPDLPEQKRIAYVLNAIDDAITQTEAVITKLKQIRTGMLHDLLSFGIDEHGELRDPIAHAEQFKESSLGRVPKEWEIFRIEDVSEKVQDGTHFSPKSHSGPRRYITSKNIRFGYLDLNGSGWISEQEHREIFERCNLRKGDLLLTKDGANTGNAAINTLDDEFSLLSSVAFVRGKSNQLDSEYLLNYILSPIAQKRIKDLMSGNAITRLTLQKIKDFEIPVPSFKEQQAIAGHLKKYMMNIHAHEVEHQKLKNVKSGLQDALLTGRVRVPKSIMKRVGV